MNLHDYTTQQGQLRKKDRCNLKSKRKTMSSFIKWSRLNQNCSARYKTSTRPSPYIETTTEEKETDIKIFIPTKISQKHIEVSISTFLPLSWSQRHRHTNTYTQLIIKHKHPPNPEFEITYIKNCWCLYLSVIEIYLLYVLVCHQCNFLYKQLLFMLSEP